MADSSRSKDMNESLRLLEESVSAQRALITAITQNHESQSMEIKKLIGNLTFHPQTSGEPADPEQLSSYHHEEEEKRNTLENPCLEASLEESIAPTSPPTWKYDVFISFRGVDTRKGFASHLFHALQSADINCYRDADRDNRGQVVDHMLIDAIHHSIIAIVLFSKNYADSKWCLQELVEIFICNNRYRAYGHTVLPIFYDVEQSEVRNQSGKVGEAFKRCRAKNKEEKETWRKALEMAGNVSSWELRNDAKDEAEHIEQIV